jgi:hypothetical protein
MTMSDDVLANAEKGEGNYKATKDYNDRTEAFLDKNGDKVDALAEDAADALDSEEGDELRRAEEEGKSHARD